MLRFIWRLFRPRNPLELDGAALVRLERRGRLRPARPPGWRERARVEAMALAA